MGGGGGVRIVCIESFMSDASRCMTRRTRVYFSLQISCHRETFRLETEKGNSRVRDSL